MPKRNLEMRLRPANLFKAGTCNALELWEKIVKRLVVLSICILSLVGCSSSTPECNDDNVLELVMDTYTKDFRNRLLKQELFNSGMLLPNSVSIDYEEVKATETDERVLKAISKTDAIMDDIDLEAIDVSTLSIDDRVKRIYCSAKLKSGEGEGVPIEFLVRILEDSGKLAVSITSNIPNS